MASIDSMTELLVTEIRDLYDAEKRLTKAIPRMSKKAVNPDLRMGNLRARSRKRSAKKR